MRASTTIFAAAILRSHEFSADGPLKKPPSIGGLDFKMVAFVTWSFVIEASLLISSVAALQILAGLVDTFLNLSAPRCTILEAGGGGKGGDGHEGEENG